VSSGRATAEPGATANAAAASQPPPIRYVGVATRGIAFAIDAAIINVIATVVAFGVALIVSILHFPDKVKTVIAAVGAAAWVLWTLGYFVSFPPGRRPGTG
jgi:hypothetical protein